MKYARRNRRRREVRMGRRLTHSHSRQPNARRMGRRIVWRRFLPALLCLGLVAFGAVRLIVYFAHSHGVKQANAELQAIYEESHSAASKSTASASLAPESTAVPSLAFDPTDASALAHESTSEPTAVSTLASESTPEPSVQPIATLKPEYQLVSEEIRPEMRALFAKNRDLVAWLRISGVVSLPVVYRDNTYYLTHDFDRKSSSAGTLFLDELHPLVPKTQHLVIHGHDMYDGTMFGLLSHARKLDFVRDHGFASLNTLYREERYVLFCVNSVPENVNAGGYIAYTGTPTFRTEHQFNAFIQALREHSFYEIPITVTPADALLTLSTCLDDERLILTYRRVREGESEESLQMLLNQSA